MSIDPEHLQRFEGMCEKAQIYTEGGTELIHLTKLKVRVDGNQHVVDAILCPSAHTGYTTRLFLSQAFPQKGANWSVHQVLGRAWHTWSWQGVPADLDPVRMLMCHLDALK